MFSVVLIDGGADSAECSRAARVEFLNSFFVIPMHVTLGKFHSLMSIYFS